MVNFGAILKNGTFQVKSTATTCWASFEEIGLFIFQHLVTLLVFKFLIDFVTFWLFRLRQKGWNDKGRREGKSPIKTDTFKSGKKYSFKLLTLTWNLSLWGKTAIWGQIKRAYGSYAIIDECVPRWNRQIGTFMKHGAL